MSFIPELTWDIRYNWWSQTAAGAWWKWELVRSVSELWCGAVAVWCYRDMCKLAINHVLHWHFNHRFEVCKYIPSGEPLVAKGGLLSCRVWKEKVPLKVGGQTKTDLSSWSLDGDYIFLQNWALLGVHIRASELYKIWPFLSSFLWKYTGRPATVLAECCTCLMLLKVKRVFFFFFFLTVPGTSLWCW